VLRSGKRFDVSLRAVKAAAMTSRISHTSFDAINAYAQSVFWSQVLDFAEPGQLRRYHLTPEGKCYSEGQFRGDRSSVRVDHALAAGSWSLAVLRRH
jgi:hypothetical protein